MAVTQEQERLYAAALTSIPHLGSRTLHAWYAQYHSFAALWQLPVEEMRQTLPGTQPLWDSLDKARNTYDWDQTIRLLEAHHVQLLTAYEDTYPALLKETYNPPAVLFYQGTLTALDKTIAIVGARKATAYGLNAAQTLAEELARQGVVIVSGGARGIDTKAHRGALRGNGRTLAIVGHGLDTMYPPENRALFTEILTAGGAILSEYTFGMPPRAANFPARNRIIAGLSQGVIVVEAALKSGSLISADFALEEGRDVFAVPGSIFSSQSRGTNALLRKGAIALTQSEDVLNEYGWHTQTKEAAPDTFTLTLSEAAVLDAIPCDTTQTQDDLVCLTQLPPAQLSTILLRLQLYGLIEEIRRGQYVKKGNL